MESNHAPSGAVMAVELRSDRTAEGGRLHMSIAGIGSNGGTQS